VFRITCLSQRERAPGTVNLPELEQVPAFGQVVIRL
jgi:hypothetical protein